MNAGTGWYNAEFRSFTFAANVKEPTLVETEDSRQRRQAKKVEGK